MGQFTPGTPANNPTAGTVLVTSQTVTIPRQYKVKVSIASEGNFWATVTHRASGGGARTSFFVPVVGPLLGPADLYETYFHSGDYVEIAVRGGAPTVVGTVQAIVELL